MITTCKQKPLGFAFGPVFLAAMVGAAAAAAPESLQRYEFQQPHMGVPFRLLFYAPDEATANQAAESAFARIAQLDEHLSDYNPQSELNRLSHQSGSGQAVPVSPDLWAVLQAAQQISARSHGAFDVTVGPYVRLWRRARREHELPSSERLAQARQAVGYQFVRLQTDGHAVELLRSEMRLDLGAIAKGYAADEALRVLKEQGIKRALVDASGDLAIGAPPPGEAGWRIGIAPLAPEAPPSRFLSLRNQAVATSGDAWQYVELGGKRYSHIVDPRTGLGLTSRSSVTVVAPDGTTADSLASAVSVLGPVEGIKLVEEIEGAEAFIVVEQEGKRTTFASEGLADLPTSH